jgi:hypothetical protein
MNQAGCSIRDGTRIDAAARTPGRDAMNTTVTRILMAFAAVAVALTATTSEAQVVYYQAYRPVVAAPVYASPVMTAPAYVANYTPAGNYAAVTAFSPPVMASPGAIAVTSNYAPAYGAVPVTSFYSPTVVNYAPVPTVAYSPVMAAPVTAYYAPTAVVAPVYRRGPLGVWRPTRTAYYIPY